MNEPELFRAASERALPDKSAVKLASVAAAGKRSRRMEWIRWCAAVCCFAIVFGLAVPLSEKSKSTLPQTTLSHSVKDYAGIYDTVKDFSADRNLMYDCAEEGMAAGNGINSAPTAGAPSETNKAESSTDGSGAEPDYSDTNLQVVGVQEADIVKTDGRYIYALSQSSASVYIVRAEDGVLTLEATLSFPSDSSVSCSPCDLYIAENRLVVLASCWEAQTDYGYDLRGGGIWYPGWYGGYASSAALVYDTSDKASPVLLDRLGQSGYYADSRMVGDTLYLISAYSLSQTPVQGKPETYVPSVTYGGCDSVVAPEDVYIRDGYDCAYGVSYTVVSAFDIRQPSLISDKSLLGYSGTIYCTADNLYISAEDGEQISTDTFYHSTSYTRITRLSLSDGKIEVAAEGRVPGSLLNQFSLDEYNGFLRVVTTCYEWMWRQAASGYEDEYRNEQSNALYVLDMSLERVGAIEGLAADERVYSVRFSGDVGYFVTFRQVDPLFSVDLSDPAAPKITGALKIPGFSEYLHPWGDGLLFGLGRNADETTGRAGCMKLSMFDVSDPADVKEISKLDAENCQWSEASYNHKAIFVNPDKGMVGFASENRYYIYGYDETGFSELAVLDMGENDWYQMRGFYIGDYFYTVSLSGIRSFSLVDFTAAGSLSFDITVKY